MLCREKSLVRYHEHGIYAAPLCCRSWTCDYCRPERKRQVEYQARRGHPNTFITLTTSRQTGPTPEARAQALVAAWRKFRRFACKHYGYTSIPFMAVFESTKLGSPHLHILCRVKWIDQRLLSNFMAKEIAAPIVDIRRCSGDRQAARYVAKYLGKAPHKFGTSKRYWQSRDYQDTPDTAETPCEFRGGRWEIVERTIDQILLHHTIHRHQLTKVGPIWKIVTTGPPG